MLTIHFCKVANELLKYDIPSISFDFPGHIDSIQGTLDDTASIEDTYKFIEDRPEITLIEMKN